jgi:hypothetical protein
MKSIATCLGILLLLSGCAPGSGTDACGPWKPIYVSRHDVLTDGTARQVLAHNETGRRICGW